MLPGSYAKMIDWKALRVPVVQINFLHHKDGQLKKISHGVKKIKGEYIYELCKLYHICNQYLMPAKKKEGKNTKIAKKTQAKQDSNLVKKIILWWKNYVVALVMWIYNYFFSQRFLVFLGVLFLGIIISYIALLFNAKRVETLMTFPGRDVNLKQLTNHPAGLISAGIFIQKCDI